MSKEPGNVNNSFLALGKDKIECIEDKVSKPNKLFSINFAKSKTKLFLSLHCNGNKRYMYASKIQIFNFKGLDNIAPHLEWNRIKGNLHNFSIDYGIIFKNIYLTFLNV